MYRDYISQSFFTSVFVTKMFLNSVHQYTYKPLHSSWFNHPNNAGLSNSTHKSHSSSKTVLSLIQRFTTVLKQIPHRTLHVQPNPIHSVTPYFLKIHCNITLPRFITSPKWCLPFRISDYHFVFIPYLSYTHYMTSPSHPPHLAYPHWSKFTPQKVINRFPKHK